MKKFIKKFLILWGYAWQRPWLLIITLLFLVLLTIAYSIEPYFYVWFTNLVLSGEIAMVGWVLGLFLLTVVLSSVFSLFAQHLGNKSIVSVSVKLMNKVMAKIHNLDFAYHANKSSGKLLSFINRGDDAVFVFLDAFYFQIPELLLGFVIMFISFSQVGVKYAIPVVVNFVVTIALSMWIMKINMAKRKEFNEVDTQLTGEKVDNLVSFETVKYFAREKFELGRIGKTLRNWDKKLMEYFFTFRYFDVARQVTNITFLAVIFGMSFIDLQNGFFDLGQLIFMLTFAMGFNWRMTGFINILRHVAKKSEDLENYLAILEEKETIVDPVEGREIENFRGEIEFAGVDFAYEKKNDLALREVNLKIAPGEVVALVGFSGAGKTTVVKLLQRMYDVRAGSIKIDGVDVREMKRAYLRDLVGIVPQESIMFNNTIEYNLAYARPEARKAEIEAAAAAAQADEFIERLPKKYKTVVGERGIKLSGGQRQRLAIARVLLKKPAIVVFDEATSSLDSHSEQAIQKSFWDYVRGKNEAAGGRRRVSAVVIAHRLSTIMKADRIVVMSEGQIVESGSHRELLKRPGSIYKKLWDLQSNGFIGDGETEETKDRATVEKVVKKA